MKKQKDQMGGICKRARQESMVAGTRLVAGRWLEGIGFQTCSGGGTSGSCDGLNVRRLREDWKVSI